MISSGLPNLDEVLGGGFPENTVLLVSGGPGTGKTLFGLNFLREGIFDNERCCYVTLMEKESELLRACKGIRELEEMEEHLGANFVIQEVSLSNSVEEKGFSLEEFVEIFDRYPEIDRVVVDNVNKLLIYADTEMEYRRKFSDFVRKLREKFTCSLVLCESEEGVDSGRDEAFECDGVINLSFSEMEEKPRRILKVHKLRYSSFEPKVSHEFEITEKGLELSEATRI